MKQIETLKMLKSPDNKGFAGIPDKIQELKKKCQIDFADLCLTTWLRRPKKTFSHRLAQTKKIPNLKFEISKY